MVTGVIIGGYSGFSVTEIMREEDGSIEVNHVVDAVGATLHGQEWGQTTGTGIFQI